jgi:hypothetical protein
MTAGLSNHNTTDGCNFMTAQQPLGFQVWDETLLHGLLQL